MVIVEGFSHFIRFKDILKFFKISRSFRSFFRFKVHYGCFLCSKGIVVTF